MNNASDIINLFNSTYHYLDAIQICKRCIDIFRHEEEPIGNMFLYKELSIIGRRF